MSSAINGLIKLLDAARAGAWPMKYVVAGIIAICFIAYLEHGVIVKGIDGLIQVIKMFFEWIRKG